MNWNSRLFKYLQRMFEWEGCWNGKILTILRYVSFSSPYRRPVSNRFQVCKTRNKARGLEREIQKKQRFITIEIKMSKVGNFTRNEGELKLNSKTVSNIRKLNSFFLFLDARNGRKKIINFCLIYLTTCHLNYSLTLTVGLFLLFYLNKTRIQEISSVLFWITLRLMFA